MSSVENFQLHLSSNYADKIYNNNNCDAEFYLPTIEIPSQYHIHLNVVHASIPFTFYNVNSSNNVLNYTVGGIDYSLIIPQGNYTTTTMKTYLNTNLQNISVSYDSTTNKYKFVNSQNNDFSFNSTSSSLGLLGFSGQTTSTSYSLISTQTINLNPIRCICVCTNLKTSNININSKNKSNIVCSIPIITQPNSIINYLNPNNFKINTYANVISSIKIQLMDQDGTLLNLNGANWTMTLQFDVIDFVDDEPVH
jgi:hypothetical protein